MLEKVRRLLSGIVDSTTQPEVSEMAEEARGLLVEEAPEDSPTENEISPVENPTDEEKSSEDGETEIEEIATVEETPPEEIALKEVVPMAEIPEILPAPAEDATEEGVEETVEAVAEEQDVAVPEERQPLVGILGAERAAELPEEAVRLMLSGLGAEAELERLRGEVEKARREGEIEGRNAKIRAEFHPEPVKGDEIPRLGGPSILRTKIVDSIFDLAREA